MARNPNWNEDELTLALALYYRIPATRISGSNPQIMMASRVIGRSPASVSLKLANFRAIDENAGEGPKGLSHGSKKDIEVMRKFLNKESSSADLPRLTDEVFKLCDSNADDAKLILGGSTITDPVIEDALKGLDLNKTEKTVLAKRRYYQSYFRSSVLSNCGNRCLISGCRVDGLLQAAHIVPWSDNLQARLSIGNGIALNPFFHEAYDRNLMGISPDGDVHFSEAFKEKSKDFWDDTLSKFEGLKIDLNTRTPISRDFLDQHYSNFRKGRSGASF